MEELYSRAQYLEEGDGLRCYKLKTLELIKRKNLVLGLTQENSIENSVQNSLPYILKPHGPC